MGGGCCYTFCDKCDEAKVPSLKIRQIYRLYKCFSISSVFSCSNLFNANIKELRRRFMTTHASTVTLKANIVFNNVHISRLQYEQGSSYGHLYYKGQCLGLLEAILRGRLFGYIFVRIFR